jgi:hypothetical protein
VPAVVDEWGRGATEVWPEVPEVDVDASPLVSLVVEKSSPQPALSSIDTLRSKLRVWPIDARSKQKKKGLERAKVFVITSAAFRVIVTRRDKPVSSRRARGLAKFRENL